MQANDISAGNRGVILIAVLWICAVISWIALAVGVEMRLRGNEARIELEKRKALYFAVGGFYETLARMTAEQDEFGEEEEASTFKPDGVPRRIRYKDGYAEVVVVNAQELIGINAVSRTDLEDALFEAGYEDEAAFLADRIMGFRDAGSLGAKGTERGLGVDEKDMDFGDFESIHQLLLVPGVEPWMFYGREIASNSGTGDEEEDDESPRFATPLYKIFSVFGSNTEAEEEDEAEDAITDEDDDENTSFEANIAYRILSTGKVSENSASVTLWMTVRSSSQAGGGYEILERRIF